MFDDEFNLDNQQPGDEYRQAAKRRKAQRNEPQKQSVLFLKAGLPGQTDFLDTCEQTESTDG